MMNFINQIEELRDGLADEKKKTIDAYSTWDTEKDARITVFSKCVNVCNSTQLSFVFMHFHLSQASWWQQVSNSQIPAKDLKIYIGEYEMFTKLGFIQFFYSSIESAFRLFVKAIDPAACNGGTAEFKSIYSYLLKKVNEQNQESLLDLFRLIRNTIHNNGVYFHKSGNNESVVYKGTTYDFIIGKAIDFVNWNFMFDTVLDIKSLLLSVINSNEVSSIAEIIDPYAIK